MICYGSCPSAVVVFFLQVCRLQQELKQREWPKRQPDPTLHKAAGRDRGLGSGSAFAGPASPAHLPHSFVERYPHLECRNTQASWQTGSTTSPEPYAIFLQTTTRSLGYSKHGHCFFCPDPKSSRPTFPLPFAGPSAPRHLLWALGAEASMMIAVLTVKKQRRLVPAALCDGRSVFGKLQGRVQRASQIRRQGHLNAQT